MFSKFIGEKTYKNCERVYTYIVPYKVRALIALLISVPVGILDTVVPAGLKYYIDGIVSGSMTPIVKWMPVLIVAFTLFQGSLTYVANYLNVWVGTKISNSLKTDLYKKLMRYSASFFDKNSSGGVQTRFNADVDTACGQLLNNLKTFTKKIFNSVGYIGLLFYISWKLAIVAFVVLGLALLPVRNIRSKIKAISDSIVLAGSSIVSLYMEAFSGNRVIASYNLYRYQMQKFLLKLNNNFDLVMKMTRRTGILSPIMHFVVGAGVATIVFMGNHLMGLGEITPGDFTAFITSMILLYQPVKTLGDDITSVQNSLLAIERIFELLEKTSEVKNLSDRKVDDIKCIEYKDVSFDYGNGRAVLQNINLEIDVGTTIAFVGNSGGGKSTLVNLLPRFYDVTSGSILINGEDVRNFDLDSLREKIAVVFQDNFLFDGTILDNIALGQQISEKEIQMAIESACLSDFISELKDGIHTRVGERGALLSGGQKQRIAIARAFIKNAPIVILDEATSALDNKSEAVVQKAIDNLMKDRTVLVIAHRLSTVKNADKIVVINYGEIAEIGTHDELLKLQNGVYRSLYNNAK